MRRLLAVATFALANESQFQTYGRYYDHPIVEAVYPHHRFVEQPLQDGIVYRPDGTVIDGRLSAEVPYAEAVADFRLREPVQELISEPLLVDGRVGVELREPIAEYRIREPVHEIIVEPIQETVATGVIDGIIVAPGGVAEIDTAVYTGGPIIDIGLYGGIETVIPKHHGHIDYKQYPALNKQHKFTDFYCPKPGYNLAQGGECCREAHCESRLECPFDFSFNGHHCVRYYEPTVYCTRGTLFNGRCRLVRSEDVHFKCPEHTNIDHDGNCFLLEEYTPVEVCPASTIRSKNGCLAVEYTEPALVCPPETIPEGKKCRREIVTLKMKKGRLLSEAEEADELNGEGHDYEEYELSSDELEAMSREALAFDELYADIAVTPIVECDGTTDCYGDWIPATSEFKIKTKKVKQPIVSEQLKWEKVKIPVTTAKVKDVKVKVPEVKVKLPKEKLAKAPHEVIKVVTQAAEKVCPIGVKHGATCVAESIVPPVFECPHPQLGPDCNRKVIVPSLPYCKRGELICDGFGCRCDSFKDFAPEITCAGGHELINGQCAIIAEWQRMCPIGFFLESDGVTCAKTDCEPALTVIAKPVHLKKKLPKRLMDAGEEEYDYEE